MTKPAAFVGSYADFKLVKTRSVVQIIFEIPLEQANDALAVMGGMPIPGSERQFAIAAINVKEVMPNGKSTTKNIEMAADLSQDKTTDRPHKTGLASQEKRLAQQAGQCCADPIFSSFLYRVERYQGSDPAEYVRKFCGVLSRSEIKPGSDAAHKWDELYSKYLAWKLT